MSIWLGKKKKERYEHSMFALGFALQPGTETPQGSSSAGKDFALTLVWGVLPAGLACLDTPARIAPCSGSPGVDMQDVCVCVSVCVHQPEPPGAGPGSPRGSPRSSRPGWPWLGWVWVPWAPVPSPALVCQVPCSACWHADRHCDSLLVDTT